MVHPVARKTLRRPLALSASSLRPFIDIASPALAREALALRRLKPGPGFGSRIRAKSLGCEIRFQTRLSLLHQTEQMVKRLFRGRHLDLGATDRQTLVAGG